MLPSDMIRSVLIPYAMQLYEKKTRYCTDTFRISHSFMDETLLTNHIVKIMAIDMKRRAFGLDPLLVGDCHRENFIPESPEKDGFCIGNQSWINTSNGLYLPEYTVDRKNKKVYNRSARLSGTKNMWCLAGDMLFTADGAGHVDFYNGDGDCIVDEEVVKHTVSNRKYACCVALIDDSIFVAGGIPSEYEKPRSCDENCPCDNVEIYDSKTLSCKKKCIMPIGLAWSKGLLLSNGSVLVYGKEHEVGDEFLPLTNFMVYTPSTGKWIELTPPIPITAHKPNGHVLLNDKRVMFIALNEGKGQDQKHIPNVHIWSPIDDSWDQFYSPTLYEEENGEWMEESLYFCIDNAVVVPVYNGGPVAQESTQKQ